MEPLKILQLHILEVQSRPRFQTAKITMQIHPKQIWEALLFNRSCLKMTSLKMTKLTHWKKNWAGVPLHIMIFRSPPALSPANIFSGDKIEKMKKWGGVLETTETYTKVPTPSGLIEERQLR